MRWMCRLGPVAARLTCHFLFLRSITRGADRGRPTGLSRSRMRRSTAPPVCLGGAGRPGAETALLGDGCAHDAQCCDEADPVGITPGVLCGLCQHRANRVVAAQMSPNLLQDKVGRL